MTVQDLDLVGLLRVLGDPTRLRLLALLSHAELSVGEMARALAMGQSRVSNHLKVLREHELIQEQPYTYFYFPDRLEGVNRRVRNVVMDARGEWLNIKDWYLDPASR